MALSAIASRWTTSPAERIDMPGALIGQRAGRDRLSDLEAGTLGELAFEDEDVGEASSPEGKMMHVTISRDAGSDPIGVELDVWARHSAAAAEVTVGQVEAGSLADGCLCVGDAIHKVNGQPCCTIEDVKHAAAGAAEVLFEVRRPKVAAILSSDGSLRQPDGRWERIELCLSSARVLELRSCGADCRALTLQVRDFVSVGMLPGRQLHLCLADGGEATLCMSATDLERWHTLLTQLMMFRPETRCELLGWVHEVKRDAPPRYFELYSNGTALIYPSPHRNKIGQAEAAVPLRQATVAADPAHAGVWLVADPNGCGAVWRCSHLQPTRRGESAAQVFLRHAGV